jgi:uncharacterized protein
LKERATVLWIVHCVDRPDAAEGRAEALPEHSARLKAVRERGDQPRLLLYGPLVADDGQTHVGSLFVVEADDRTVVEGFVADDPLTIQGVWQTAEIRRFQPPANSLVQIR